MWKSDIEWRNECNTVKEQRDIAIELAREMYRLSYCGCAITECTCGLEEAKRQLLRLELRIKNG